MQHSFTLFFFEFLATYVTQKKANNAVTRTHAQPVLQVKMKPTPMYGSQINQSTSKTALRQMGVKL